jgi:O-methyltransferase
MTESVFVTPWNVANADECDFYHTMEIPGHGLVQGLFDLRGKADEYLGHYDFAGKRVLEIGPASGFLTFEMEKRGAEIVVADVGDEHAWDFVPYPESALEVIRANRRQHIRRLKSSFWFAHRQFGSRAKAWYGDVYNLPDALGQFDVAVMAAVLLHVRSPVSLMAQAAKRASALIVTDLLCADLEGKPLCRLHPTPDNREWDTWWDISSDFIRQFASILEFNSMSTTSHEQQHESGVRVQFFTVIASRMETRPART